MLSTTALNNQAIHYAALTEELKAAYQGIDDETLADTVEGLSDLPDLLQSVIRSSLEDEALAAALKARHDDMQARLARIKARALQKREITAQIMGKAGLTKMQAPDFSVSLRAGSPKAEILDETKLGQEFLIPQPPKIAKAEIFAALKRGEAVDGAQLAEGAPHIAVRTK